MSLLLRRRMLIANNSRKKSKNLFNIDTYGEFKDADKNIYIDISHFNKGDVLTISVKSTHILKLAQTSGGTAYNQVQGTKMTFTITQTLKEKYHLYIISTKTWSPATKEELLNQDVQLEYGTKATDYEPYY